MICRGFVAASTSAAWRRGADPKASPGLPGPPSQPIGARPSASVRCRQEQPQTVSGASPERERPGHRRLPLHGHVLARIAGQVPRSVVASRTIAPRKPCGRLHRHRFEEAFRDTEPVWAEPGSAAGQAKKGARRAPSQLPSEYPSLRGLCREGARRRSTAVTDTIRVRRSPGSAEFPGDGLEACSSRCFALSVVTRA